MVHYHEMLNDFLSQILGGGVHWGEGGDSGDKKRKTNIQDTKRQSKDKP